MIALVLPVVAFVQIVQWATRAAVSGGYQSRIDLVLDGADSLFLLSAVWALTSWATIGTGWWFALIAPLGLGAYGVVRGWSALPTLRNNRSQKRSLSWAGVHTVVLIGLLVLLFG